MIFRSVIVFALVLMLMPRVSTTQATAGEDDGLFAALQGALLADIAQVRADIAESQRDRAARSGSASFLSL